MDAKPEKGRPQESFLEELEGSSLQAGLSHAKKNESIQTSFTLPLIEAGSMKSSSSTGGVENAETLKIENGDRWRLPPAMWCRRHGFSGRVDSDWVERKLGIQDGKLVALYGKHEQQSVNVAACQ
eukprot:873551-Rhodomonas_salina.1